MAEWKQPAAPKRPAYDRAEIRALIHEALEMVHRGEILHAHAIDYRLSQISFVAWHRIRCFECDLAPAPGHRPPAPKAARVDQLTDEFLQWCPFGEQVAESVHLACGTPPRVKASSTPRR